MARQMDSMSISFKVNGTLKNVLDDGTGPSINHPSFSFTKSGTALSNGINDNEADRSWQSKDRTILSGVTETLDLYDLAGVDIGAGAGLDGLGQAIVFEEIVLLVIVNENDVGDDGALEIEPSGAFGWTPIGSHTVALGGALYGQGALIKLQAAAVLARAVLVRGRVAVLARAVPVRGRVVVLLRAVRKAVPPGRRNRNSEIYSQVERR